MLRVNWWCRLGFPWHQVYVTQQVTMAWPKCAWESSSPHDQSRCWNLAVSKKHIGHDGSGVLPKGTRLVKQVFGSFWFHLFLVPSIWFHLFLVPSIFGSIYFWFHIWFHLFLVPSSWFHLFGKCKFHHITWHNFNLADNHKFWWWPDTFFFKPSPCSKTCYIT